MIGTVAMLGVVYAAFVGFLVYLGVGTVMLLVIVAGALLIQYFLSDRLVLSGMGARLLAEDEAPQLHETMTRLSAIAGIPRPRLAVVDSTVPNAFAAGRSPKNAVIAVTTGLMQRLNRDELEAVLAHELSHVRNRDVVVITIAGLLSTAAFFIFRFGLSLGGSGRGYRGGGGGQIDPRAVLVIVALVAGAVYGASFLLIRALSRYREFSADRGSALLTGQPSHLASALAKISGLMERVPTRDLREVEGMNAFFIIPAASRGSILGILDSHPPVEARIAALERLEREMG